jgi:hypothetical protein
MVNPNMPAKNLLLTGILHHKCNAVARASTALDTQVHCNPALSQQTPVFDQSEQN